NNQVTENKISIYPNPVYQFIIINGMNMMNSIDVTDVFGRTIIQQINKSSTQQISIDVSSLPSGIYFVKVIDLNGNSAVGKFVKE
ncbi:MAG: hypothetical protein RL065_2187, partial [Bacteroidota bacterium]